MLAVIVQHYVLPEFLQEAETLIRTNGRRMRSFHGFVSRQTLRSHSDPFKITTVTCWERREDREGWDQSPERREASDGADRLWSKSPEVESFDVVPEL